MKFSFSTKGWHNSTFEDFCAVAGDLKFQGIELHNIYNRLFTEKDGAFHDHAAAATVRRLYEKKFCRYLSQQTDPSRVYCFQYDSRLDAVTVAYQLRDFINEVKFASNSAGS